MISSFPQTGAERGQDALLLFVFERVAGGVAVQADDEGDLFHALSPKVLRLASSGGPGPFLHMTLQIDSEIGRLRTVLVHEPGREIDRMVPSMMQDLLFDDILFGARAREEHRRFRQVLKFVADEVLEARDLLEEVLQDAEAATRSLTELATLLAWPPSVLLALNDLPSDRLAAGLVEGIERPRPEITGSLDSLYVLPPVPNWFFQRDPAVVLGDRVIRSAMATRARWREPLLSGAIFAFHPRFGRRGDAFWFREFAAEERRPVARAHAPHARGRATSSSCRPRRS